MDSNEEPLRLPPGHDLFSLNRDQIPAAGGIYLARFPGDLEALFGPARELRDREFLLELDGQQWLATPMPGIFLSSSPDHVMVFDAGGIHARTSGEESMIDFQLLRKAGSAPDAAARYVP
jgi:hypothetical protein